MFQETASTAPPKCIKMVSPGDAGAMTLLSATR